MKKNLLILGVSTVLILIVAEAFLRIRGYEPAHAWEEKNLLIVKPDSFFNKDALLGWRLGMGEFDTYLNDQFIYKCTVNKNLQRITRLAGDDVISPEKQKEKLFILGCSTTFGIAVSDSSNYPYFLQNMLPGYDVQNLAVPAFGLTQMYLRLKQEVENGNKPRLVIVNYGNWLDDRTGMSLSWLRRFKYAIVHSAPPESQSINYPRCRLENDGSLMIDSLDWSKWPADFPLRDKLVIVDFANTAYDNYFDKRNESDRKKLSLLCSKQLVDFCARNDIKIAFFGYHTDALIDSLKQIGVPTKASSVNIQEERFHSGPLDSWHPNARAFQVYANEVVDLITSEHLIEK